jgi:hypothetical protein
VTPRDRAFTSTDRSRHSDVRPRVPNVHYIRARAHAEARSHDLEPRVIRVPVAGRDAVVRDQASAAIRRTPYISLGVNFFPAAGTYATPEILEDPFGLHIERSVLRMRVADNPIRLFKIVAA